MMKLIIIYLITIDYTIKVFGLPLNGLQRQLRHPKDPEQEKLRKLLAGRRIGAESINNIGQLNYKNGNTLHPPPLNGLQRQPRHPKDPEQEKLRKLLAGRRIGAESIHNIGQLNYENGSTLLPPPLNEDPEQEKLRKLLAGRRKGAESINKIGQLNYENGSTLHPPPLNGLQRQPRHPKDPEQEKLRKLLAGRRKGAESINHIGQLNYENGRTLHPPPLNELQRQPQTVMEPIEHDGKDPIQDDVNLT